MIINILIDYIMVRYQKRKKKTAKQNQINFLDLWFWLDKLGCTIMFWQELLPVFGDIFQILTPVCYGDTHMLSALLSLKRRECTGREGLCCAWGEGTAAFRDLCTYASGDGTQRKFPLFPQRTTSWVGG